MLSLTETIIVDGDDNPRLDIFLAQCLPGVSRSKIQKLIKGGRVLLNQEAGLMKDVVKTKDIIEIKFEDAPEPVKQNIALDIIFEDDDLIVLNKAAGVLMHRGAGRDEWTLADQLCSYAGHSLPGSEDRSGIVHRLDRDTTGVVVCVKTNRAFEDLKKQFSSRTTLKEYSAVLMGAMQEPRITIESYIGRNPKKRTRYKSFADVGDESESRRFARSHFLRQTAIGDVLTLAAIRIETGRTHQIRVHAKDLGLPVLGDQIYGRPFHSEILGPEIAREVAGIKRQMLHAKILGFEHPITKKKMIFEAKLPSDMERLITLF